MLLQLLPALLVGLALYQLVPSQEDGLLALLHLSQPELAAAQLARLGNLK